MTHKGIDVVYLLGTGAAEKTNDWELRISLRSVLKHFAELRKIWIVGHRPEWLDLDHPQIQWIPAADPYKSNKDANLVQKLIRVATYDDLTERFLFFSDDQGLLQDCVFSDFQPYHCGRIDDIKLSNEREGHRKWQDRMVALGKWLKRHGYSAMHFDGHIPYPIEKRQVKELLNTDYGFGAYPIMSLYFNIAGAKGKNINEERIRAGLYSDNERPRIIDEKLSKNRFYSIGNGSPDCWYLVRQLEQRFPDPAPWEIGQARPRWEETIDQAKELLQDLQLLETAMPENS